MTCPSCGETLAFADMQKWPERLQRNPDVYVLCTNHECNLRDNLQTEGAVKAQVLSKSIEGIENVQ